MFVHRDAASRDVALAPHDGPCRLFPKCQSSSISCNHGKCCTDCPGYHGRCTVISKTRDQESEALLKPPGLYPSEKNHQELHRVSPASCAVSPERPMVRYELNRSLGLMKTPPLFVSGTTSTPTSSKKVHPTPSNRFDELHEPEKKPPSLLPPPPCTEASVVSSSIIPLMHYSHTPTPAV
ncbi:hypothetical protein GN956_G13370 [Arapaima gigas]